VRHMRICWACGVSDDTHPPRAWTSRRRYRFQAFAEAFFLGGCRFPLPETARARSARDTRPLIAELVALGAEPDEPEAEVDPEVGPVADPLPKAAAVAVPAAPAALEVPAWLALLSAEPTTDGIEECSRVPPPVGDEELGVLCPDITDDGAGVAGMETLGADTERVVADGTVAVGEVTDGTVATGVLTFGVVIVGVVTFGVVTVGVVTFGVVTVGVVTFGVVTVGVVTFGVVTVGVVIFGVLATGVETLGVDTAGTATLGTLTWGVLTAGALTAGTAAAGALTAGALTAGTFTGVAGSDWSADATAARPSARLMMVAARRVRRRVRPIRLDPDTTRIGLP
jgi:hypothetical protein